MDDVAHGGAIQRHVAQQSLGYGADGVAMAGDETLCGGAQVVDVGCGLVTRELSQEPCRDVGSRLIALVSVVRLGVEQPRPGDGGEPVQVRRSRDSGSLVATVVGVGVGQRTPSSRDIAGERDDDVQLTLTTVGYWCRRSEQRDAGVRPAGDGSRRHPRSRRLRG